jgi:hypothetical protein
MALFLPFSGGAKWVEDLFEFAVENYEEYTHAAAGFGIGATTTYLAKLNAERQGRVMFPESPEEELRDSILEDDPNYDEPDDGPFAEVYYDNFDTLKKNVRQGAYSGAATILMDAVETFSLDSDFVGFEDHPKMAAGFYAGIKAAEYTPTPSDAAEAFREIAGEE